MRRPGRALFWSSALALFVELALIRWVPNTVHIVAFFANLVLIASFLGLGIGMVRPSAIRSAARNASVRIALLVAGLSLVGVAEPTVVLDAASDYAINEDQGAGLPIPFALVLVTCFAFITWAVIPFGRIVASRFDELDRIAAYSINVAGSLAGVVAFSLLSWLGASPFVWFGVVLAILAALGAGRAVIATSAAVAVALAAGFWHDSNALTDSVSWSPYYKIRVALLDPSLGRSAGFVADVNNQFLLSGLDLRPDAEPSTNLSADVREQIESLKTYYAFPFVLRTPTNVLILGAGAGNDVAAALRGGAASVTAVEIDPHVLKLADDHPEMPFQDPRVESVLQDARAFLRGSGSSFDLILFATLDAHGLLSSVASVRLDSFVYTLESLEEARGRLAPGGLLVLSFGPFREDVQYRQYSMVRQIFSQDPLYYIHDNGHRTIVAGAIGDLSVQLPEGWREITADQIEAGFEQYPYAVLAATDDWPHLYISERRIPQEYILVLVGIVALGLMLVRMNLRDTYRLEPHFMFLGAGFLLLETKSVTEFALLVGSTWLTNSLVFAVILTAILGVNLAVARGWLNLPIPILFGMLGVALLLQASWPVSSWAGSPGLITVALAGLYLGVPILLASSIFASSFRSAVLGTAALASNLVGSVVGGISEYGSLIIGLRGLSLLALLMYLVSFFAWHQSVRRQATPDQMSGQGALANT